MYAVHAPVVTQAAFCGKEKALPSYDAMRIVKAMEKHIPCPKCDASIKIYKNPAPTTDVIIYDPYDIQRGVVLIERVNEPFGFALPGGFVDEGESVEQAAVREMQEETNLQVELEGLLGVYSAPNRDPRFHTLSIVFVGKACNPQSLCAGDDAKHAAFYPLNALPPLAFDHAKILQDYVAFLEKRRPLAPVETSFINVKKAGV